VEMRITRCLFDQLRIRHTQKRVCIEGVGRLETGKVFVDNKLALFVQLDIVNMQIGLSRELVCVKAYCKCAHTKY